MITRIPNYPGSRWWKFDFHTHTPKSTDTQWHELTDEDQLKPKEWLQKYMDAGIDCVAVTDHNSGGWVDELKSAYAVMKSEESESFRPLHLFPGVEISVQSGFHLLAIFDSSKSTSDIDQILGAVGYSGTLGDSNEVTSEGATKVIDEIVKAGGIAIPAHVDIKKGLLQTHKVEGGDGREKRRCVIDSKTVEKVIKHPEVLAMEVITDDFDPPQIHKSLDPQWTEVLGTDCHKFDPEYERLPGSRFTWVKMGEPSLAALKLALHDGGDFSVRCVRGGAIAESPNEPPAMWMESMEITDGKFMGRNAPASYRFSPWMNAVIGGRGSGKSTLVHFIRLTGQRSGELDNLKPDDRPRKSFEQFNKVSRNRQDLGGLLEASESVIVYRKGNDRFRLTWKAQDGGTTVEERLEMFDDIYDDWQPADSQDVTNRFPLTIFSQDQVGTLAENPHAILKIIDEAIGKADWDSEWDQALNRFLTLLSEIRALSANFQEEGRLKGEFADLTSKLKVFESSEHAEILKMARKFKRQKSEMEALFEAHGELSERIGKLREDFELHDLPSDVLGDDEPIGGDLSDAELRLRKSVKVALKALSAAEQSLITENSGAREDLFEMSSWSGSYDQVIADHEKLVAELREKGVTDPNEFSKLIARRQTVEKQLKEIERTQKEVKAKTVRGKEMVEEFLELRFKLHGLRQEFLDSELRDNLYVKIDLVPFGGLSDLDSVESELRDQLECPGSRFEDAIRNSERGIGIVEALYRDFAKDAQSGEARTTEIISRLKQWKEEVTKARRGKESELPLATFRNHLATQYQKKPEVFDRLHSWWPEDSLEVSYSKDGKGRDFTPIRNGSAGEKAAALLAFFLAQGDCPLVIDQPENDLDNHLITDLVVRQLRETKQKRQVIVVTHNPNIVVNGDAEMVHAMGFKNDQCRLEKSGALQNVEVRDEVCQVMEGGRRALEKRYQRLIK
ncbi:AAA family ATPase [bacterium]|nr:AAA family ATPase [bacterium]